VAIASAFQEVRKVYRYSIWGTEIISDIELDLNDKSTKNKLVEAKMMVDRSGTITKSFLIKNGMILAYPEDKERYQKFLTRKNEEVKDFHEEVFDLENLN